MLFKGLVLNLTGKYLASKVISLSARRLQALYFEVVLFTKLYKASTR